MSPAAPEQRLIFGEVAELYDKARAGWSDAIVDEVLAYAGSDGSTLRALEIGAGTGKATVAFASRGVEIVALEPSEPMAAVARRNCTRFPKVRIELTSFEDWPLEPAGFGLVLSAQAWHWVRPEVRLAKTAQALTRGGTLALFWHRTDWHDEDVRRDLEDIYLRVAPDLHAQAPSFPGLAPVREDEDQAPEFTGSDLLRDVTLRTHHWSSSFTPDTFVELLLTQSNHRVLPEAERAPLLDAVREYITGQGGKVVVPQATFVVMARTA